MIRLTHYCVSSSLLFSMMQKFGWVANIHHAKIKALHFCFSGDGFNCLLYRIRTSNWFKKLFLRRHIHSCEHCIIFCINWFNDQRVLCLSCFLSFSFLEIATRNMGLNLDHYAASTWVNVSGIHFYVSVFSGMAFPLKLALIRREWLEYQELLQDYPA